jgi:hypothetical protein
MYSKLKYESILNVINTPNSLLLYRSEKEIRQREKLKNEERAKNAEIFIKYFKDIHDEIYNKLKKKHDQIFSNEVLSKLDSETKNQLIEIKKNIEEEYSKKQYISFSLLCSLFEDKKNISKDQKKLSHFYDMLESMEFLREFPVDKYAIFNCEEHALFVNKILNKKNIKNYTITAKPDHGIPVFLLGKKVFFYDLWFGGLIGEFEPNFFYKYCDSGGLKDFGICIENLKNTPLIFKKVLCKFEEFQKTKEFQEILRNKTIDLLINVNDVRTIDSNLMKNIQYLINESKFKFDLNDKETFLIMNFIKKHQNPETKYISNSAELFINPEHEKQLNEYKVKINNVITYDNFVKCRDEEIKSWDI